MEIPCGEICQSCGSEKVVFEISVYQGKPYCPNCMSAVGEDRYFEIQQRNARALNAVDDEGYLLDEWGNRF